MDKIEIKRSLFLGAVQFAGCLAGKVKSFTYGETVKISIRGDEMKIASTDLESYITHTVKISASVENQVEVLVNKMKLCQLLNSIKDETIKFNIIDTKLIIEHEKGKCELACFPAADFPIQKVNGDEVSISMVKSVDIARLLICAKKFIERNDIFSIICGVNVTVKEDRIYFASTNGRMLFFNSCECSHAGVHSDVSFTISSYAIDSIVSVCRTNDDILLKVTERSIIIECSDVILTSTQKEGKYPETKKLLSVERGNSRIFNTKELTDSLNRIQIAVGASSRIFFDFSKENIVELSSDGKTGDYANETVKCDGTLDKNFAVNVTFFLSALSVISSDSVKISAVGSDKSIFVTDEEDEHLSIIVMPVM